MVFTGFSHSFVLFSMVFHSCSTFFIVFHRFPRVFSGFFPHSTSIRGTAKEEDRYSCAGDFEGLGQAAKLRFTLLKFPLDQSVGNIGLVWGNDG